MQTTEAQARSALQAAQERYDANPSELRNRIPVITLQLAIAMYIRGDNTPEKAEYLGYIDAKKLLPDFKYRSYANFIDDLLAGEIKRPYPAIEG